MYRLDVSSRCGKIFARLGRKNPWQMRIIREKISQILVNPEHFKLLKGDMKGSRRVHIDKSFVLIYEIDGDTVRILNYDHHDYIYK